MCGKPLLHRALPPPLQHLRCCLQGAMKRHQLACSTGQGASANVPFAVVVAWASWAAFGFCTVLAQGAAHAEGGFWQGRPPSARLHRALAAAAHDCGSRDHLLRAVRPPRAGARPTQVPRVQRAAPLPLCINDATESPMGQEAVQAANPGCWC